MTVQEGGNLCQSPVEQRIAIADADCGQRLGPEIAHFENKRNALPPGEPPPGESDEQLWGGRNHHLRTRQEETCNRRGGAKRAIVQHALVCFPVRKRKEPGADDVYSVGIFMSNEAAEFVAVLGRNDAGGMIWEPGEDGHVVPGGGPMARQLGCARSWRAHLRRKV